jgi:lipoate-protein ligase A
VTGLTVWRSTGPASHDLAFEAEMLEAAADGRPSLTVASWPGPVVVLGYGQPVEDVDLRWCRERSLPVLRRLSGGTGVIHRGDLSASLALPADHPWARGVVGLYDRFLEVLQPALASLGSPVERVVAPVRAVRVRSPVCFFDQLADTLAVGGRKAVGCSQTRRRGGVLVHAAVLLGLDPALFAGVFRVDEAVVERSLAPALTGVGWATAADALVDGFSRALGWAPVRRPRPRPARVAMAVYDRERWAPVPDDGIVKKMTELE